MIDKNIQNEEALVAENYGEFVRIWNIAQVDLSLRFERNSSALGVHEQTTYYKLDEKLDEIFIGEYIQRKRYPKYPLPIFQKGETRFVLKYHRGSVSRFPTLAAIPVRMLEADGSFDAVKYIHSQL